MVKKMDMEEQFIVMEIIILANIKMDLKKESENIHILMKFMKENIKKVSETEKVNIFGKMEKFMKENGKIIS